MSMPGLTPGGRWRKDSASPASWRRCAWATAQRNEHGVRGQRGSAVAPEHAVLLPREGGGVERKGYVRAERAGREPLGGQLQVLRVKITALQNDQVFEATGDEQLLLV